MNTNNILLDLIPEISKLISKMDLNVGDGDFETTEFCYDMDGWMIEMELHLKGEWSGDYGFENIRGKVSDLKAEYYNEDTDEDIVFNDDDLFFFREDIEDILNNLG